MMSRLTFEPQLIIAEVGVNHNGNLRTALELIKVAKDAGADIVKFQTFKADKIVNTSAPLAQYQSENIKSTSSQREMLAQLELSHDMHKCIKNYCDELKIEFLSTAFDVEDLRYLLNLGIKRVKVPSGEITNLPFLEFVGGLGLPVILSTGMASLGEVREAVGVLTGKGLSLDLLTILHCTSEYPAAQANLNLAAITTLQKEFKTCVGYSDHSEGCHAGIVATALGATVIEKHITLHQNMHGPDHKASMEPEAFVDFVKTLKSTRIALGKASKLPTQSELETRMLVRKSIVAKSNIPKGALFTSENICTKRPGTGISAMRWYDVVGQKATQDFFPDDPIKI